MESNFYFYRFSQGNQEAMELGGTNIDSIGRNLPKHEISNISCSSISDRFWLYYDKMITSPIKANPIEEDEKRIWLKSNKIQKALIAMNVLIGQGNNGGTFGVMINYPRYYFTILEALKLFELDELAIRYSLVKAYVDKHFGTIDQLDHIWQSNPELFESKYEEFIEIHDERIIEFDTTDELFWDNIFQGNMYQQLVDFIENNI